MGAVRRPALLAIVAAAALVVAACGGDESAVERSADPATSTTTTAASGPSSTTSEPPTTTTTTGAGPGRPSTAATADELATRLVAAEQAVRDPETPPDELAAAAFEQQILYRQLARTGDWHDQVLAQVPEPLHLAVSANVAARREFRSMHRKLSDALPPWRIVEPPPADELLAHYQEGEATFGVPWEILAAVNLVETGMGRIRGTSVAGAQGPMQFMPATWDAFGAGGDINDPRDAILGAARYLAHNGGGRGEIDNALWNYNHSDRYVRGVKHYASVMADDPRAFYGFHQWRIVYLSTIGDVWLPVGYEAHERVPASEHVARNPRHHLGTATG